MAETTVSIAGNIVNDVELKHAETGPWMRLRIAVNNRRFDRERNDWVDGKSSFFTVVVWRELAENCFHSLRKGQTVMVMGRLETNEYTTGDGDVRREEARIVATHVGPTLRWGVSKFQKTRRPEAEGAEESVAVDGVGAVDPLTGEVRTAAAQRGMDDVPSQRDSQQPVSV
ncbi:MAG: single-stranded DNA-binding protein [Actinomycetales bacterium]